MRHALHAEWTKVRTLANTFWLLLATAAVTASVSAAAAAATRCPSGACADDPAKISLTGIYPGQAVIAVLAVMAVTLPISPWAGLGVLAAWAVGALLLGGLLLRVRDA